MPALLVMKHDVAIVGSGFAGSLLAMIAARLGKSVILIERGRHPRFAIGESSTPLANLLFEHLANTYDLPGIAALAKWGSWQKHYPNVACGLKRGFTFYHHRAGQAWRDTDQLLVAASPNDYVGDTHWYRADFDHLLVTKAQKCGVEFVDETKIETISESTGNISLTGERSGKPVNITAQFLIDATGPRGLLHRCGCCGEEDFSHLPPTVGLYTHFRNVRRWDDMVKTEGARPYPVDAAAMHHVFDGGWIWVLRFNNGITSAGIAATQALSDELRLPEGAAAWDRVLHRFPSIRKQFADATSVMPFIYAPRLSFRAARAVSARWALLPSAAGVIDPLLSTGFPLTLLGTVRLAKIIERHWNEGDLSTHLAEYERQTFRELDLTQRLVAALYRTMHDFNIFAALTLLYFAAASFTETAWRLGEPELAGDSFLLGEHPTFARGLEACLDLAFNKQPTAKSLMSLVRQTIEPIDIAGLGEESRWPWYPVRADDLLSATHKLDASSAEVAALLKRVGF